MRKVIVTTEHRAVFYGTVDEETQGKSEIALRDARMVIRFGTTRGLWELCDTGPTANSKIGARAPRIEIRKITAVADVSEAAAEKFEALP